MSSFLATALVRLVDRLTGRSSDRTANRRRRIYKDKVWTAVEQLEDRTLLSGTGGVSFEPSAGATAGQPVNSVAVGQFSGPASTNLVAGKGELGNFGEWSVLAQNLSAVFHSSQVPGNVLDVAVQDVVVADFDGDGDDDVATASQYSENGSTGTILHWWRNISSQNDGVTAFQAQGLANYDGSSEMRIAAGDVDNDGDVDLVALNVGWTDLGDGNWGFRSLVTLWNNNHSPDGFSGSVLEAFDHDPGDIAVLDFNGDENLDIAVSGAQASGDQLSNIYLFVGHGDRTFEAPTALLSEDVSGTIDALAAGDFNGDGQDELVAGFTDPNGYGSTSTLENVDGAVIQTQVGAAPVYRAARAVAVGDVNGDGNLDVVTAYAGDSWSRIIYYQNEATFPGAFHPAFEAAYLNNRVNSVVLADLNNDGLDDIVTGAQTNDGYGVIQVFSASLSSFPIVSINAGATVDEGGSVDINAGSLEATDAEQSALELVYTVTVAPQHGVLRLNLGAGEFATLGETATFTQYDIDAGLISYLHDGDENSTADSFAFTVSDGTETTDGATFALTVVPANDAPTAVNGTLSLLQDSPVAIDLAVLDSLALVADAETTNPANFTYEVLSVTHGTAVVNPAEGNTDPRHIVFTPELGYVGPAVITVRATDTGDRGAPPSSIEYTITVDLTAPIAQDDLADVDEDGFVNIDVLANDTVYGEGDSNAVQISDPSPYGTAVVNADRTITFTPNANFNGETSFEYTLVNAGGTTRVATVTVNVASINDAPTGADNTVVTAEDTPYVFTTADFGFSDENDLPSDSLLAVVILSKPLNGDGTLKLNGNNVSVGQAVLATDIAAGKLVFTPRGNGHGDASFTFQVKDDGGTANDGVDLAPSANTMTITVVTVNDAPAGASTTVTTNEDEAYIFATADFGFTDPNDDPANDFSAVTIDTLPVAGVLKLAGTAVSAGDSISATEIASGLLVFHPAGDAPAGNATGAPYASFTFRVQDDGGVANGGVDIDPSPNTLTINVTPVADVPALAVTAAAGDEDTAIAFSLAGAASVVDADGSESISSLVVSDIPVGAALTDGTRAFNATAGNTSVNVLGWSLVNLRITPPANSDSDFTLQVTATSREAANGSTASRTRGLSVTVAPVADLPAVTVATASGLEDQVIPLSLSAALTDTDGSESLSIVVTGVPVGATLSDGIGGHSFTATAGDTSRDISGWTQSQLRILPTHNSDIDFVLTFTVTATEADGLSQAVTTKRLAIVVDTIPATVGAVADAPDLSVANATGDEDTAIPLTVAISLTDTDGSESLRLFVTAIPVGATLRDGSGGHSYTATAGATSHELTGWTLAELTITPPQNSDVDFTLTFTARSTEAANNDQAETTADLRVTVLAVADAPTLTTAAASGDEDTVIPLTVSNGLVDTDGSETRSLTVSGLPVGSVLSDGPGGHTYTATAGSTSLDLTGWQLSTLRITPPANDSANFVLTFTSTATEADPTASTRTATTVRTSTVTVNPVNDAPVVNGLVAPTIDQASLLPIDLRTLVSDVETSDDDLVFQIVSVSGGLAMGQARIGSDGHTAFFLPNPDFVGIADFTFSVTDAADFLAAEPGEVDATILTRTGVVTFRVLRYQDLGDAPDSYGTLAPSQENSGPDGARHGGTRLNSNPVRFGSSVGYGESDGQPSEDALGDDGHASSISNAGHNTDVGDDENGVIRIANLASADDRELIRTLRIEAPAGGKLDAWIDFNLNKRFDSEEHLWGGESVILDESNVSEDEPGVYYVKFTIPRGAVNFDGGVDAENRSVVLEDVTTYARFRISTQGGLAPTGFAADGEVEDFRWNIKNVTGSSQSFDAAADEAVYLFVDEYASELIEDPNYQPPAKGQPGYVPFTFSGSGSAGDDADSTGPRFERGETDPALAQIVAKINNLLSADRGQDEMVFVFVVHPVDFIITDPNGRQVGQTGGTAVNQIGSNVSYTGSGPVELLVIRNASAGEYKMEFTGTGGVFRGGATLITSEGQQLSTFQGALVATQEISLALDFTAPTQTVSFENVADGFGAGKGQVFFNVKDGAGDDGEEDDLSALLGLDAENQSTGDLDPRAEIKKWIRAVTDNARATRRVVLDELTPDWLAERLPESQELMDAFWTGLGQSMLGGIPGQVFHLAEFLGVDVPLLFAPQSEAADPEPAPAKQEAPAEERTAVDGVSEVEMASADKEADNAGPQRGGAARYFAGGLLELAQRAELLVESEGSSSSAPRGRMKASLSKSTGQ